MNIRRITAAIAVVGAASLVLAGCSGTKASSGSEDEIQANTTVSVAENGSVTSLNQYTPESYSTYNGNVQYLTQATFNYYNDKSALLKNTALGTYTQVSANPLVIKYTLNKGAKWSDGTPIKAADLLLAWASFSTQFNDKKSVNFDGNLQGAGWNYVTKVPDVSSDGQSITMHFDKPYVDWEVMGLNPNLPAHIVYDEAFPDKKLSASAAQAAVQKAIQDNDTTTLKALATAWSTKWNVTSMPSDTKLLVGSGAYVVSAFVKDQYITLTARKNYANGPKPHIQKITFRFIPDQTAQVQALQNGEVSVLYGQATADTVKALSALSKIKTTTTSEAFYEHIELTFKKGSPFSPLTYGGDAAKALKVRQAFLKIIPRQEILDRVIKPIQANAKLMDSNLFIPGTPGYDQTAASNGYSAYNTTDVSGAKALLAAAGVKTPVTVKFAYPNDNPRRASEFQLIQKAASASGLFNVVDDGKPTAQFFAQLGTAGYPYDVSLFGYVFTSLSVTGSLANTYTGNPSNYGGFSDPKVDALWNKASVEKNYTAAIPDLQAIDKQLVDDAQSLTLVQPPTVSAWASNVENVSDIPLAPNIFWNYFDWKIKK